MYKMLYYNNKQLIIIGNFYNFKYYKSIIYNNNYIKKIIIKKTNYNILIFIIII